jgi:hypothetical protein
MLKTATVSVITSNKHTVTQPVILIFSSIYQAVQVIFIMAFLKNSGLNSKLRNWGKLQLRGISVNPNSPQP